VASTDNLRTALNDRFSLGLIDKSDLEQGPVRGILTRSRCLG
jgi:hypothetical protein